MIIPGVRSEYPALNIFFSPIVIELILATLGRLSVTHSPSTGSQVCRLGHPATGMCARTEYVFGTGLLGLGADNGHP